MDSYAAKRVSNMLVNKGDDIVRNTAQKEYKLNADAEIMLMLLSSALVSLLLDGKL